MSVIEKMRNVMKRSEKKIFAGKRLAAALLLALTTSQLAARADEPGQVADCAKEQNQVLNQGDTRGIHLLGAGARALYLFLNAPAQMTNVEPISGPPTNFIKLGDSITCQTGVWGGLETTAAQ